MSDTTHGITSALAAPRASGTGSGSTTSSTRWSELPVGESRFHQVRRQLRALQVQRAVSGARAA